MPLILRGIVFAVDTSDLISIRLDSKPLGTLATTFRYTFQCGKFVGKHVNDFFKQINILFIALFFS